MKRWKQLTLGLALVLGLAMPLATVQTASAIDLVGDSCEKNSSSTICGSKDDDVYDMIKDVINVVLGLLGIVAVIMIIIGGFRYVTSAGEAKNVASAKNTILYAVVGLVVAILAFAIVNFVIDALI